ncbi:MAG: hypothetical protein U0W24_09135 [Bacteroidales bacterium]
MENNKTSDKIGNSAGSFVVKYDLAFCAIVLIFSIFDGLNIFLPGILKIIVLSGIALLYFLSVYSSGSNDKMAPIEVFIKKFMDLSSSVVLIGFLFLTMNWPNNQLMIFVSIPGLLIPWVYIVIQRIKNQSNIQFGTVSIVRTVFLFFIAVYTLLKLNYVVNF